MNLIFFLRVFTISKCSATFIFSVPRGPKGFDSAGGDPGEVAEGAGGGAEGPGVDGGEAAVFLFHFFGGGGGSSSAGEQKGKKGRVPQNPPPLSLSLPLASPLTG